MKAKLKFNLPDDSKSLELCVAAEAMHRILTRMEEYLMSLEFNEEDPIEAKVAADIRQDFRDFRLEEGFTI